MKFRETILNDKINKVLAMQGDFYEFFMVAIILLLILIIINIAL